MTVTANAPNRTSSARQPDRPLGLLPRITCPHCWHRFQPSQALWVSEHADLVGDQVLGPEAQRRFLPSRFTADCQAIDAKGSACQLLACPNCHLIVPRPLFRSEPYFLSLIGGPSSGKTWLLTTMIWSLRRLMLTRFGLMFNDADSVTNSMLNEYEGKLFMAEDPDAVTTLIKTEEKAFGFYDNVLLAGQRVQLPKPFVFRLSAPDGHPLAHSDKGHRVFCLYDNAGESFQPGHDSSLNPTTQHLAKSRALMFLFDPTQDPRFREQCRRFSPDPQLVVKPKIRASGGEAAMSQHTLLVEAANRVRRYAGLASGQRYNRPLLVLVSKSDVWGELLDEDIRTEPLVGEGSNTRFDLPRVERVSRKLRELLLQWTPEIVSAVEEFCQFTVYLPVSALGTTPEPLPGAPEFFGARPRNILPRWVTVPFLYMFAKWSVKTVPTVDATTARAMTAEPTATAAGAPSRSAH